MSTAAPILHPRATQQDAPQLWSTVFAHWAQRHRYPLFAVILALYLLGFNGQWQLEPDSALYLDLGRNISLGRGFTYHGAPHLLAYPGLPYALAAIFRIFDSHAIFAADALMLFLGLAGIACTYRLVDLAYDRANAVVVALGVGICHELYRYCFEIMTDVPFFAGVMAFLAGYQGVFGRSADSSRRRWWDWALLVSGVLVCVTTRPNMLGLVGAWIAAMLIGATTNQAIRKPLLWTSAAIIAALIAFMVIETRRGSSPMSTYEQYAVYVSTHDLPTRLHEEIPANIKDVFLRDIPESVAGMPLGYAWLNALFGVIFTIGGLALWRKQPLWGLWVAVTLLTLVLVLSHDRYVLQILPLLVLGWWRTLCWINARLPRTAGNVLFVLLFLFGFLPNFTQVVHVILQQRARPFLATYKEGRYPAYVEIAGQLPLYASRDDAILCPIKYSRILTFLSDRQVMEAGEFNAFPTGQPVLVILDKEDENYLNWLADQRVQIDGPPLLSVARDHKSPILLTRAVVR